MATIALALAFGLSACGSGGGDSLSHATANQLAAASDEIASDLDSGDTCGAAHRADDLKAAIQAADLPDGVRPQVEAAATELVDEVNCEPAIDTTQTETKPEDMGTSTATAATEHGPGPGDKFKPPKPGDDSHLPPGQAKKLKGGI